MKYHVWYEKGSCNDGSHSCGLQTFDREEDALAFARSFEEGVLDDPTAVIIKGEIVPHVREGGNVNANAEPTPAADPPPKAISAHWVGFAQAAAAGMLANQGVCVEYDLNGTWAGRIARFADGMIEEFRKRGGIG